MSINPGLSKLPPNITKLAGAGNDRDLYAPVNQAGQEGVAKIIAGSGVSVSPTDGLGEVTVNNSGVTSLVAGANITLSGATGAVTITASGGGGGAVASVSGSGAGINVTPTTGAVVVQNTGVTSLSGSGAGICYNT